MKLGLIAGSGNLPLLVAEECKNKNIELFLVLLENFAKIESYEVLGDNFRKFNIFLRSKNMDGKYGKTRNNSMNNNPFTINYMKAKFGEVGRIMRFFKKNGVKQLVFAGALRKPSFFHIHYDLYGCLLMKNILKNRIWGDNSILETLVAFLKKYDLEVLEIDKLLDNVKLERGFNTTTRCDDEYFADMNIGIELLKKIGDFDMGQAVVVQQRNIMGIECFEGTAALIERCAMLKYAGGRKPILVKAKKVNQTRKIDLPSIGLETVEQLHVGGYAGVAVDAANCLIINREKVLDLARKYGLFIYGF